MSHGPFAGIDVSRTGLGFDKYWLDTIAHNVANLNTVTAPGQEPFRARMVHAMPIDPDTSFGGGVYVSAVTNDPTDVPLYYDPDNVLADENGNVQGAVVDLSGQLGDMILASRSYQSNMSIFKDAREALEAATGLGRR
ncbi:MAG: flagellar basal body rod C-terminal domain-containing protein [Ilumatobacteraceae bacterium]